MESLEVETIVRELAWEHKLGAHGPSDILFGE